jgi:hypothetical protein
LYSSVLNNTNLFSRACHPTHSRMATGIIALAELTKDIKELRSGRQAGDKSSRTHQSIIEAVLQGVGDQGEPLDRPEESSLTCEEPEQAQAHERSERRAPHHDHWTHAPSYGKPDPQYSNPYVPSYTNSNIPNHSNSYPPNYGNPYMPDYSNLYAPYYSYMYNDSYTPSNPLVGQSQPAAVPTSYQQYPAPSHSKPPLVPTYPNPSPYQPPPVRKDPYSVPSNNTSANRPGPSDSRYIASTEANPDTIQLPARPKEKPKSSVHARSGPVSSYEASSDSSQ